MTTTANTGAEAEPGAVPSALTPVPNGGLGITVLDSATIFQGADTVHRFDLPGSGIVAGWAVSAVVDQAREMLQATWPEVEIVVDAPERETQMLTRTFLNMGVACYSATALGGEELPVARNDLEIRRPIDRDVGRPWRFRVLAGVVALAVVAGGWWIARQPSPRAPERAAPAPETPVSEPRDALPRRPTPHHQSLHRRQLF